MHDSDRRWRDFYNRWARTYDFTSGLWSLLMGYSDTRERRKMVRRLDLKPGQRVLEVSVGTGSNLPLMAKRVGPQGRLVGLDISTGMLHQCRQKLQRRGLKAALLEGEAAHLPFPDKIFDAVLHFGGINEFGDKKGAIEEMMRVAKPGARVVIADEGLAPAKRDSLRNRLLMRINPLYAREPPLGLIPPQAKDVRLCWFRGDACYLIDFTNP